MKKEPEAKSFSGKDSQNRIIIFETCIKYLLCKVYDQIFIYLVFVFKLEILRIK